MAHVGGIGTSSANHPQRRGDTTHTADDALADDVGATATASTSADDDNTSAEGSSAADDAQPPELEGLIQGYVENGTPLRRQLRSIGETKRLRLEREGITTIEGLAAIDTTNAELCMRLSCNQRPDRAIRRVTEWKNEAQRFLRLL